MQPTVFFSSDSPPTSAGLFGHAFSGSDLILGQEGYEQFLKASNRKLEPGEDGSYIVINKKKNTYEIGCDYAGYMPIYVYTDNEYWAFSNSFHDLADHLSRSRRLSLDRVALCSSKMPRLFGEHPSTLQTPISGLQILPRNKTIQLRPSNGKIGMVVADMGPNFELNSENESYEELIFTYVKTWVARHCTLLRSNVKITIDVTGGSDSRASLALCMKAAELTGVQLDDRIYFNSNSGMAKDFEVSQTIANNCNFKLRNKETLYFPSLTYEASYKTWLATCLHSYWPVYFPIRFRSPDHVWLGGAGGESHRWHTTCGTPVSFNRFLDENSLSEDMDEWKIEHLRRMRRDLVTMQEGELQLKNLVDVYYQNYRERFHHGRRSTHCNAISPLASKQLHAASRLLSSDELKSHQAHVDISNYCAPELNNFSFANDYPNFGKLGIKSKIEEITENNIELNGRVYAGESSYIKPKKSGKTQIALMQDDFEVFSEAGLSAHFITRIDQTNGQRVLEEHKDLNAFRNTKGARPAVLGIWAGKIASWTKA